MATASPTPHDLQLDHRQGSPMDLQPDPWLGLRCFGDGDPLYAAYHDSEWGQAVCDENAIFERICLEAFQSGLSWLTILRKREAFRSAFAGFDPVVVASFDETDVARLLGDAGIVRNRAKIEATIRNARATLALHAAGETLTSIVWAAQPDGARPRPASHADLQASTPESTALSQRLKRAGFAFVGPTTAYAAMQACGVVFDHLASCPVPDPG